MIFAKANFFLLNALRFRESENQFAYAKIIFGFASLTRKLFTRKLFTQKLFSRLLKPSWNPLLCRPHRFRFSASDSNIIGGLLVMVIELLTLGPATEKTIWSIKGSSVKNLWIRSSKELRQLVLTFWELKRSEVPILAQHVLTLVPPISIKRTFLVVINVSELITIARCKSLQEWGRSCKRWYWMLGM